ncbi:MAG: calcium-binding protein [Lachnospiraceae bacterium]|nr:calcium-binding protein [Lachnospiraceae bacterium]
MTAEELIEELLEKISNNEDISVDDLREIIENISIEDNIAASDAVTILYSGEKDAYINMISNDFGSSVRMINRTEAYKLLSDDRFSIDIFKYALECDGLEYSVELAGELLYKASGSEGVSDSFWSIASRRFAGDTKGNVIAFIENAKEDRIFNCDELVTWLKNAPDNANFFGVSKAELLTMSEYDRFNFLKGLSINNLGNSLVYIGESGEIIGYSFKNTILENVIPDIIPEEYAYMTNHSVFNMFERDAVMLERYGDMYDLLSTAEKFQLKEFDYLIRSAYGAVEPEARAAALLDYMRASGKNLESLSAEENALIELGSALPSAEVKELISTLSSWSVNPKMASIFKYGFKFLGVAITAYEGYSMACDAITDAKEAISKGDYFEAAGIIAGKYVNFDLTFMGGIALTEAIAPVFMIAGLSVMGPGGIIVGGLLAATIAFKIADFVGDISEEIIRGIGKSFDNLYDLATTIIREFNDPLVIDLDKDGFELLSVEDGVFFNEDANGLAEKTAWVSPDDGLLAIDLNGDGIINGGSELFGDSTILPDGSRARSGFEALAQYDLNDDGVLDIYDDVFSRLRVWQDRNSDGISQQDELYTLEALGIRSISLNGSETDGVVSSAVEYADGSTCRIGEFYFASNLYDSREIINVEISEEIMNLPDVRSIGNVSSLHTLMQLDTTGTLKTYVEQFMASESITEKENIVKNILYFITGADDVLSGSRGEFTDAKKLTVVEQFMGRDFVGTEGENPVNKAGYMLDEIYFDIFNAYYCILNSQTDFADCISMTFWEEDKFGRRYLNTDTFRVFLSFCEGQGLDMSDAVAEMGRYIGYVNVGNNINLVDYIQAFSDNKVYLEAISEMCFENSYFMNGDSYIREGTVSKDFIYGDDNNNSLYGYDGSDYLYGNGGNDSLYGCYGNDVLIGGAGDDYMEGGDGTDVYIIGVNDGNDTIENYNINDNDDFNDKIIFGEGINPSDIELRRWGNNLYITNLSTGQITTIKYQFWGGMNGLTYIEFADGTVWDSKDFIEKTITVGTTENDTIYGNDAIDGIYGIDETIYAGAGDDTVNGDDGDDILYGESGNDRLFGCDGNDVLIGGAGEDYMEGGEGEDTYIIGTADGNDIIINSDYNMTSRLSDKIVYGEGINPEDIILKRYDNHLYITNKVTGQMTTVKYQFWGGTYGLARIEFADGTVWDSDDFIEKTITVGTAENDTIYGSDAINGIYSIDETIYAGTGDDFISGNDGNDILYGEEGDDKLFGGDGDDILIGGTGNDRLEGVSGDDTYIFNLGDGKDVIWEYDYNAVDTRSDKIVFGNGITSSDVNLSKDGNNLIIDYSENDTITIMEAYEYSNGRSQVEYVEFADGTTGSIDYENLSVCYDETDELVNNMVNLAIQGMSEASSDNIVSADSVDYSNTYNEASQLWVQ